MENGIREKVGHTSRRLPPRQTHPRLGLEHPRQQRPPVAHDRAGAPQRRSASSVIDPYRTRTAALADWHIAIRPGTDAALALGMMYVILKE